MKTKLSLLFLLAFTCSVGFSQQIRKSQPDSIIKIVPDIEGRHFFYTVGGRLLSPEDLRMRLLSYDPSAVEYRAAKTNLIWGFTLSSASGIAGIASVAAFASDNRLNGSTLNPNGTGFIYAQHSQTGAYILTGAAVGLLTAAIITFVKGSRHLKKSFWLYNMRFQ
jgi:hypothetical protein